MITDKINQQLSGFGYSSTYHIYLRIKYSRDHGTGIAKLLSHKIQNLQGQIVTFFGAVKNSLTG